MRSATACEIRGLTPPARRNHSQKCVSTPQLAQSRPAARACSRRRWRSNSGASPSTPSLPRRNASSRPSRQRRHAFAARTARCSGKARRQGAARRVAPEDPLLIVRLPRQQLRTRRAVRRRHPMPNAGARLIDDAPAGPVEAERQVHVLEVGGKGFGEAADRQHRVSTVERAGRAGAEDGAGLEVLGADGSAAAALAGDAAEEIAVTGAVDARRPIVGRSLQHQRRHGGHGRVGEPAQGGVRPAGLDLGIVIKEFGDGMSRRMKAGVGGDTESATLIQAQHADAGKRPPPPWRRSRPARRRPRRRPRSRPGRAALRWPGRDAASRPGYDWE